MTRFSTDVQPGEQAAAAAGPPDHERTTGGSADAVYCLVNKPCSQQIGAGRAPCGEWARFLRPVLRAKPECLPKPAQGVLTSTMVWGGFA